MKTLKGYRYPWTASVEGDDLVVKGEHATWFGGEGDRYDDGSTASGISTKGNPDFLGCALPMDFHRSGDNPCAGSPLPKLAWFTKVLVTNHDTGAQVTVSLIDLGPSAPPAATAAIDLTQAAFKALGGSLAQGRLLVDFRILGGAKQLGMAEVSTPASESPTAADGGDLSITPEFLT